ncbi:phage tail tape measure protein [Streptomyces sp. PA03-6a]|nr:phage tail tape measure protein [Streptomyces sp. PA03-6a]
MSDTSLVFSLTTRDNTADGMRSARRTIERETSAIADAAEASSDRLADSFDVGPTIQDRLGGLKEMAKGAGLAAGAAAGMALIGAFAQAMDQGKIIARLRAQLGATPEQAQRYGKLAGNLYANAVTEDFQGAADTISAVMRAGIAPPDATNAQLESISTKVADLANLFELDLGQTANAVGQMIKTGLAKDGTEALDALTAGLQKMGPRADDIADTFNEYSTIFRQMGISASEATGLLSQGMKAGARDTDVVADSLKEFVLLTQGGGAKVDEAFKKIGLSGKEMQAAFVKGGPEARAALDKVFDGLRGMKSETDRNAVALALFGTKSEDTQKALMALDPSKAVESLGKVKGAADEAGNALRDNAGSKVTQFKRRIEQGVVEFLGGTVIPAMDKFKTYVKSRFSNIWDQAGEGGTKGADRILAFFSILKDRAIEKIKELGPKVISGLAGLGGKMASYVAANPEKVFKITAIAAALVTAFAALPAIIASALLASAAMIILGFVKGLVGSLLRNLPKWWSAFTGWVTAKAAQAGGVLDSLGSAIGQWFGSLWTTYVSGPVSRTWNSLVATVRALPGRAVAALSTLGSRLSTSASTSFQSFRTAAEGKASSFISWVRGLPGRIASGIGSLGSLLYGKGQDIVSGLWRGIQSMGSWLRSTLMGWARNLIPGPIAKALGIASPSKVLAEKVGRWIPLGVVEGIKQTQPQLQQTTESMVAIPQKVPAAEPVAAPSYAAPVTSSGAPFTINLNLDGQRVAEIIVDPLRRTIRNRGGGDVQAFLGT